MNSYRLAKSALVATLAISGILVLFAAQATEVAKRPLRAELIVKPNVIFGMDDSASMDWEILISAYNGILNWKVQDRTYWSGTSFLGRGDYYMSYLFPNGTGVGAKQFYDDEALGRGVPPSAQFAALRSNAFNPLYYNPDVHYVPWRPAYHNGALRVYGDAQPTAAKSHPALSASVTMDLTADQTASFYFRAGMMRPDGNVYNSSAIRTASYFPATYWVVDATCTVPSADTWNQTCVSTPDGRKLRKVEIKPGNYPTTAAYNADLQNFANWWSYYRKRKLMLAAAMGSVLENLNGLRLGVVAFNRRSQDVVMVDSDAAADSANRRSIAGYFYTNPADSGTPTSAVLNYIGRQYRTSPNAVQYSCQKNNAFIVTDGFANDIGEITPPAYNQATYGGSAPYSTTSPKTLADIALSYFTTNLRNGRQTSGAGYPLSDNRVPLSDQSVANPDSNRNLHMNTYAITLGASGELWPAITDPFAQPIEWGVPLNDTVQAIDDLWHATINGRGKMFKADDSIQAALGILRGLQAILAQNGGQSSTAFTAVNLSRGDGKAYVGKYTSSVWTGDVSANPVDGDTGQISAIPTWSASQRLLARDWTTRIIATSRGGAGRPFNAANAGDLVLPAGDAAQRTAVINYLSGDRSLETTVYREREGLIGPVINAMPVAVASDRMVYAATGEGMLHALDADDGAELWAYVPGSTLAAQASVASQTYYFETKLDGTPTVRKIGNRRYLVGGLGTAGAGYYALDVTNPRSVTSAESLASRVLWEIPNGGPFVLGQSTGRPVIVDSRRDGPVVLFTQGYNGSTDGRSRMYMVHADTGVLIHAFEVAGAAGDLGLSQISAVSDGDGKVTYAYGGDLQGNLWRFNLADKTVAKVASFKSPTGVPQPITTAPEVLLMDEDRIVLVGTGRLLGLSDFTRSGTESFYAVKDSTYLADPRSAMVQRTVVSQSGGVQQVTGSTPMNWATKRGWFVDLPAGLQVNTDPTLVLGSVSFIANKVSVGECASDGKLFAVDALTGLKVANSPWSVVDLGSGASSVTLVGTSGSQGNRVVAQFQTVDGTTPTPPPVIPVVNVVPARKNAWRLVPRME